MAVVTLVLTFGGGLTGYFVHLEGRLSRVEQKVDDAILYMKNHR